MTRRPGANRRLLLLLAFLLALLPAARVGALYVMRETAQVPVERLVANLEKAFQDNPRNVESAINLARLHAMAYAQKAATLPAIHFKPDLPEQPWYGNEPPRVPSQVVPAPSSADAQRARAHLQQALDYYETALALDPQNLTAMLGHAWTLDQSGDRLNAMAEYRRVIAQAWITEQKASRARLGQRFFTEEAAGYLIALLDKRQDAAEIAELQSRRDTLRAMPRPVTPIAIPLRDDVPAQAIVDPHARVAFDADGTGLPRRWTWITPDAGWLVYDARDSGTITSALQLFGSVTFWLFWSNGYHALAALDDNRNGELAGAELAHLAIWQDRNGNGESEPGEVQPLSAYAIVGLSVAHVDGDGTRFAAVAPRGVRFADGRERASYDVILSSKEPSLTMKTTSVPSPLSASPGESLRGTR